MMVIYTSLLLLIVILFVVILIKGFINKNSLINSLYWLFTTAFWLVIITAVSQISMQIFTEKGIINTSKNGTLGGSNHTAVGYSVPVNINLSFRQKKIYKYNKKDTITGRSSSGSFTKFSDKNLNFSNDITFLEKAGITKKQLDSIFEFSPDVITEGKKLQIDNGREIDEFLKTNTSSFQTKGYVNIKSTNWFFTFCQLIKSYLGLFILIIIFYQLKAVFKGLKKDLEFSFELSKRIKWVGLLIIGQQLLALIISLVYSSYYGYIGFEEMSNDIQLNINPRLEFDLILFIVGLSLIVLSILFQKGGEIQQENDLTI